MKKIIFVHLLNDFSGSPKVLLQVINACNENEMPTVLYTGKGTDGFLNNKAHQHYYYYYKRFDNKILTLLSFFLSQFHLFIKLLKYHNEEVVFYVNTMLPFGAGLAGKILKKEVIYHIHETSIKPELFKSFLRKVVALTAKKIIFVSNSLKVLETFNLEKERVIFNALPSGFLNCVEENNYLNKQNNKDFTILMACSLRIYKGILEFLKIAENCEKTPKIKFQLVLNATDEEVNEFKSKYHIPKNVKIFSKQEDLHPFYSLANLVLNLSRIDEWVETFGLTIIEAMGYGIPVIVPTVGGPSEIVTNDKEGFSINSYETELISKKIIELYHNPKKCLALSKNCQIRVQDFSEQHFNKQILNFINE
jgi:glycosyltransferase involved in cell wall biosynthesis